MSKSNHKPEWHEPVEVMSVDRNDPLEDTIEVGEVTLIDGPIDPVPLGTASSTAANYNMPRRSAGPMPDLSAGNGIGDDSVKEKVTDAAKAVSEKAHDALQSVAGNAKNVTQKIAESASGANVTGAISSTAGRISAAGAAGAQSAGAALWTIIQRNPLQAIAVFASVIWLLRSNKAAASQPTVSLSDAAEKVGSVAGQVQVTAGNLRNQVQDQVQHGAGWFGRTLQENPLAIGAMAIVFGAGLGFAVPESPYEDNLLGKTRDKLADKAQEAAQDFGQKVQTVAQTVVHEAVETVKEEAKNQGLTA